MIFKTLVRSISIPIMERKSLHFAFMVILGLLFVSCNSSNEPVSPSQYRISWIHSDSSLQLFDYDSSGRISIWKYVDSTQIPSDEYNSTYKYFEEEGLIEISSEEKRGADTWIFKEKLFLNQDGTASHANGNVTIMKDGEYLLIKKNYVVEFHYNSLRQLTNIGIVEKRADDTGWEEATGLEWFIELEWKENNLIKYAEYSNINKPSFCRTFAYYGGETVHYMPILQGSILRHYYLPLQYQGLFGSQSVGLVKDMTVFSNSTTNSSTLSYDISTSIYSSAIEGYSILINGKEIKYTVSWESYNQN